MFPPNVVSRIYRLYIKIAVVFRICCFACLEPNNLRNNLQKSYKQANLLERKKQRFGMIFMYIFWGIMIFDVLLYLIAKLFFRYKIEDAAFILMFLAFGFLIVAILAKDAIFQYIPPEYEWVAGLFTVGLGSNFILIR
jgi:hypothetical protein